MGLIGILFILFLTLKLLGAIDWSWWSVTAPLWVGYPLIVALFLFAAFLGQGDTRRDTY